MTAVVGKNSHFRRPVACFDSPKKTSFEVVDDLDVRYSFDNRKKFCTAVKNSHDHLNSNGHNRSRSVGDCNRCNISDLCDNNLHPLHLHSSVLPCPASIHSVQQASA